MILFSDVGGILVVAGVGSVMRTGSGGDEDVDGDGDGDEGGVTAAPAAACANGSADGGGDDRGNGECDEDGVEEDVVGDAVLEVVAAGVAVVGDSTFVVLLCWVVEGDSCIEVVLVVSCSGGLVVDLIKVGVENTDREERVIILSHSMGGGVVSTVGSYRTLESSFASGERVDK